MKRLLQVPLRAFVAYSMLVLSLSIPVYYVVVDAIWLHELDDHNEKTIEAIENFLNQKAHSKAELELALKLWNQMQPGTQIEMVRHLSASIPDSVFSLNQKEEDDEEERYRVRISYVDAGNDRFRIVAKTNVEEADETLWAISTITGLFFVVLIAGFILLNRSISRKSWKDFEHTLSLLKNFDITRQQPLKTKPTGILEFYELNQHLEALTASSISAYAKQKRFIENASHELQTPLAILKSKLDLLLETTMPDARQGELLSSIHQQISRVSRINKNLLFLAKIENEQFPEFETLDVHQLAEESLQMATEVFGMEPQRIHRDFQYRLLIAGSPVLVEVLINNLMVNALIHNLEGGEIWVRIHEQNFSIENSGNLPLKEGEIFERFSISTDRNTRSGLGLAIVKEICHYYGWEVKYRFFENRHSFTISF